VVAARIRVGDRLLRVHLPAHEGKVSLKRDNQGF
jgi:hypothetical protein